MREMDEIWREALRKQADYHTGGPLSPPLLRATIIVVSVHLVGFSLRRRWQHLADFYPLRHVAKLRSKKPRVTAAKVWVSFLHDRRDRLSIVTDANHFWTRHERDVPLLFFLSFFFLSFLHRWFYRRIVESEPSTLLIGHQSPCPFAYMESNSYFVDTSCERYSVYLLLFRKMCIYFAAIEICQSIRICNSFTFSSKDVSIFHFQLKVCNNIPNWARIFDTYMEII